MIVAFDNGDAFVVEHVLCWSLWPDEIGEEWQRGSLRVTLTGGPCFTVMRHHKPNPRAVVALLESVLGPPAIDEPKGT